MDGSEPNQEYLQAKERHKAFIDGQKRKDARISKARSFLPYAAAILVGGIGAYLSNNYFSEEKQETPVAETAPVEPVDKRTVRDMIEENEINNVLNPPKNPEELKRANFEAIRAAKLQARNETIRRSLQDKLQEEYGSNMAVHNLKYTEPDYYEVKGRLGARSQMQVGGWREATITLDDNILMYERLTVFDAKRDPVGDPIWKYCEREPANEMGTLAGILRFPENRLVEFENGELYGFTVDGINILVKPGLVAVPDPEVKGLLRKDLTDKELKAYTKGIKWAEEELRKFKEGFDLKAFSSTIHELMTPGALQ